MTINIVYAPLKNDDVQAIQRGPVSAIWSAKPIVGCDIYLYYDALSFTGRMPGFNVLFLSEPITILPGQFNEDVWKEFDHVVTFYEHFVNDRNNFSYILCPRLGWANYPEVTENASERNKRYPLAEKENAICMIAGYKHSQIQGELYSKRVEIAQWFHEKSSIKFDVFGNPPFPLENYRGSLSDGSSFTKESKYRTLAKYKFSVAFENIDHPFFSLGYVSEKMLDCFETRTIPIYLGCANIEKYIPTSCFIDIRKYSSNEELEKYLLTLTDEDYRTYIKNIDEFVESGKLGKYSWQRVCERILIVYEEKTGVTVPKDYEKSKWMNISFETFRAQLGNNVQTDSLHSWNSLSQGSSAFLSSDYETTKSVKENTNAGFMEYKLYYKAIRECYNLENDQTLIEKFVHPVWAKELRELGLLIENGLSENFLHHRICFEMFVRVGWNLQQESEMKYMQTLPKDFQQQLFSLKESYLGAIPIDCKDYPISVNTLGMLWYYSKVHEKLVEHPKSIIEFGGGFGSLARVFKTFEKNCTYTIIDLPEMLALQTYYLSEIFGEDSVVCHLSGSEEIVEGKINLYPVFGVVQLSLHAELFISTFALSETPAFIQALVGEKKNYFGATHVYITGQLRNERTELGWEEPFKIITSATATRNRNEVNRFHIGNNYEMFASSNTEKIHAKSLTEIGGILFSKDRAMQLECTLESFSKYCKDEEAITLHVVYTTSSELIEKQYQQLAHQFPTFRFERETDFRADVLRITQSYSSILFLVDDSIFVRSFSIAEANNALKNNKNALGFSLRLGKNTTFCYMYNAPQTLPQFNYSSENILSYRWIGASQDFGYPLEVSSSLYKVGDIIYLLRELPFTNPNTMEFLLDANKSVYHQLRDHLLCFETTVAFCNPINKVQSVYNNRSCLLNGYSTETLTALFEYGFRIDVEHYAGLLPNAVHQEKLLKFNYQENITSNSTDDDPIASIIIITYNGVQAIKMCVESIFRNTKQRVEIIVVDMAKNDGTLEYLESLPEIVLIKNSENIGYSPARAQAMSIAQGKYFVSLDDDTVVTEGWLEKFIAHAEKNSSLGLIGPRTNYASGLQIIPGVKYNSVEELEKYARTYSESHRGNLQPTNRLVGFCIFMTKEVVKKIGCVDHRFGKLFGFDDDDFSLRAQLAGFTIAIADDIFIHHTGGPQGRGDKVYNELMLGAWEMFKTKWGIDKKDPYGTPIDIPKILNQSFNFEKHGVAFLEKSSVEKLLWKNKKYEEEIQENFALGIYYMQKKKYNLAVQEILRAYSTYTDIVKFSNELSLFEIYMHLGDCYLNLGQLQESKEYFEHALNVDPESAEACYGIGLCFQDAGIPDAARQMFEAAVALKPNWKDAVNKIQECEEFV